MGRPGRRREEAPEGYATVGEVAEALGMTRQAVRQRIEQETLTTLNVVTEGGGEARYYIPWKELERAKLAKPDEEAPRQGGPLSITVHRPELARTVRIETGPEETEIHLDR